MILQNFFVPLCRNTFQLRFTPRHTLERTQHLFVLFLYNQAIRTLDRPAGTMERERLIRHI